MVKSRLSGRTELQANDIEETFHAFNVDKVYGAPVNPEFIPFGDEGLYYLNVKTIQLILYLIKKAQFQDKKINIIEKADEYKTFIQTADAQIEKTWLVLEKNEEDNDDEEQEEEEEAEQVEETREDCFKMICEAVVGSDRGDQVDALNFLEEDCFIGSMMDWFYNFVYILLNEHDNCDFLTTCAFSMLNSLEGNPISDVCVSEKQVSGQEKFNCLCKSALIVSGVENLFVLGQHADLLS